MTQTEIKKALYKEKPTAKRHGKNTEGVYYTAHLKNGKQIFFVVPNNELTEFHTDVMGAQLLIRWISPCQKRRFRKTLVYES